MATQDNVLFYQRLMGAAGLAIIAYLVYQIIEPFLGPIAWALFFGFLLQPVQARLTRLLRGRDSVFRVHADDAGPGRVHRPADRAGDRLRATGGGARRPAAGLAGRASRTRRSTDLDHIPVIGRALQWLDTNLHISTARSRPGPVEGSKTLFQELASYGGIAFMGAVGTVLAFTVMLFILFFIIRDGRAIARLGSTVVPLPADRRETLAERLASVTRAVVRGTVLTSIVQGLLLGIGFASSACRRRWCSACWRRCCRSCPSAGRRWSGYPRSPRC